MNKINWNVLLGAAFLMAMSAIGPGFLTQTALFTSQLGASFACIILLSILIDIVVQLNIWRVISVAGRPAQDIANSLLPGLGYLISGLVFLGGLAFNIGNVAGAGLGLNVLMGTDVKMGAALSAGIAIAIFIYKEAGKAMDLFAKVLGCVAIALMVYITFKSNPPVVEAVKNVILPEVFSFPALLTIVGGTVGGYITFAGAHRLLDQKISGLEQLPTVNRGAVSAIGIASLMRILLFLAALGVVSLGNSLDEGNPAASIFQLAAGNLGYKLFGLVLWAAAITSVVGAAYTSVSFIRSFNPWIVKHNNGIIIAFIIFSSTVFLIIGRPVQILVIAGALNGMILPISLGIMLLAAYKQEIVGAYKQPKWLTITGVLVLLAMAGMALQVIMGLFS
jgi:Mn2+/Fe2+ NRAMP family transporter